uniref:SEC14-like protein 1 n=1 Tax=Panagrolaimus superbus TaxID=310955 RepID=A0A914Z345_9BILA
MVQTYQSPVRIYKHPFEIVMAAYQKRFPTCPQIPIFVGSEITSEYHSPDGAVEVLDRKCQLNVDAPYLVKKIAGVDYIYFNQKNSLDRRKRTLDIEATNISFASRIAILEKCNYYVHPENKEWTCFEQSASLDVKSFFGFETTVEKLAVKQYAANLAKGKEILEFFIEDLLKSGTTYIPPFQDSDSTRSPGDSAIDVSKTDDDQHSESQTETETQKEPVDRRLSTSHAPTASYSTVSQITRRQSTTSGTPKPSTSGAANGNLIHATSFDDPESKLEAEYIRRFLGQLNPLEESRLCELKYGLQTAHKGKLPNDAHLLRFLRARDFDVSKARDMVINSLLWRKQHNVDKLIHDFQQPPVLLQFFPGAWHHHDKLGRPLFVLRLGNLDVKGLLRTVGLEALVKLTLLICEQGLAKTEEATKSLGQPISAWTMLVDLEGLSMRHLWRPGVQALLRIIEIVEANYPETMGHVLISRAPRVFPVMWTLISQFIDENTRKKFMINSGESILNELGKYIDKQYLPDFLGGQCYCVAPEGGHVPKEHYRPVEQMGMDGEDALTSTYTAAYVHRGMPHEIAVEAPIVGSVLTWDFDVLKGECEFLIYHTNKKLRQVTPQSPTSLNPVERVTAAIGSVTTTSTNNFTVALDPELKLNQDLTIQERPVLFCEGDSMQGSHYCHRPGTYILQWRHPEPQTTQPSSAFDFSLSSSHKAKLMLYYELLDAHGFHGSVASLESCRSSFSSLVNAGITQPSVPNTPLSHKKDISIPGPSSSKLR